MARIKVKKKRTILKRLKKVKKAVKSSRTVLIRKKARPKKKKSIKIRFKNRKKKITAKPKKKVILRKIKKIITVRPKNKVRKKPSKKVTFKAVKNRVTKRLKIKVTKKPEVFEKQKETKKTLIRSTSLPAESFKPKIRVIGVGGGGGSIVSEIGKSLDKATFVVADTDVRAFKKRWGIKYFLFGTELTHGLGTGLNTDLAKEAAEREKEKISQLFKEQDIVILVACLGGGLGSGAAQVFLDTAKDFSGITLGIFTLPFKFEGKSKHKIATKALRELRKSLNVSITIPNERIFKVIDENTPITDAFSMVNKSLIQSLESLIDLIQSPGLINIDFADLRAILQGKGNLAFLNTSEASGKDKAEEVIKNVFHNPLYQDNFIPEKVLFNIEGGRNLSMFEVDKISKAISEKNPKAKIIFGISRNPKYKNKIKTTLLMVGPVPLLEASSENLKVKEVSAKKRGSKKFKSKKLRFRQKSLTKNGQKVESEVRKAGEQKISVLGNILPVFGNKQFELEEVKKISVTEKLPKKTIRRTALEIKEAEALEKNKKSKQEEEWEIPAFLRFKKVK